MKPLFLFVVLLTCSIAKADDSLTCKGELDNNGKKNGSWVCRDKQGRVIKKEHYKHGEIGTWILYNNKGQMIQTRNKKGKIRKYKPCGC